MKKSLLLSVLLFSGVLSSCNVNKISNNTEDTTKKESEIIDVDTNAKKYTITWVVDGKVTTSEVNEGQKPDYGSTPTKEPTLTQVYPFLRWEPEITPASKNTTYTAVFSEGETRKYTVTFKVNGKIYSSTQYEYDSTFTYPSFDFLNEKDRYVDSEGKEYNFGGWNPDPDDINFKVTKDLTFEAILNPASNNHFTFFAWSNDNFNNQKVYTKILRPSEDVEVYTFNAENTPGPYTSSQFSLIYSKAKIYGDRHSLSFVFSSNTENFVRHHNYDIEVFNTTND